MSKAVESAKPAEPSLASAAFALARYYLRKPWVLIVLSAAVLVPAAILNWGWLVAVGVAPLLLALAPCAAMCALGLCASRMGGKSSSSASKPEEPGKD